MISEKTNNSPKIIINSKKNEIYFEGPSYMDSAHYFYSSIKEEIENYCKNNNKDLLIVFKFTILNSISYKSIFSILKSINKIYKNRKAIVNWCYEKDDEDSYEDGKLLEEAFDNIEFSFVEFEDFNI